MPVSGRGEKRAASGALRLPATPQRQRKSAESVARATVPARGKRSGGSSGMLRDERRRMGVRRTKDVKTASWRAMRAVGQSKASSRALRLFEELYREYSSKLQSEGVYDACEQVASIVSKRYKEFHAVALELLLSISSEQVQEKPAALDSSASYRVISFRGKAVDMKKRGKWGLSARMARHRKERKGGRREALCCALACLCCRLQKNWLDAFDDEVPVRGYFAHALVDPSSTFRVALRPGRQLRLASLLITNELPFGRALAQMDHGGPFPEGHEKEALGTRQYGLQRICAEFGTGDERKEKLMDVQPEDKLRELMGSNSPVLVLDVYCALAPKEQVQQHNLGGIIRQELMALLRCAKQRGMAVVFLIGGEHPAQLAEKVYLQPWFTSIGGLRCGYLRWKQGPNKPWEPPTLHHTKRVMFGLQLP